jgi:glutathione-regulated potassium-efflux system ancillary protein KefG
MRILVLFAHPKPADSTTHRAMLKAIAGLDRVTIRDLYAAYPDMNIDVAHEQELLLAHDVIVFQHPVFWYSSPAIIKEWLDLVLEHNWAYGPEGKSLHGKFMLQAVSTGGQQEFYGANARNRYALRELFAPFSQTAHLCGMGWLEPFCIYGGRRLTPENLMGETEKYRDLLIGLRDGKVKPLKHLAQDYALPANFTAAARSKKP